MKCHRCLFVGPFVKNFIHCKYRSIQFYIANRKGKKYKTKNEIKLPENLNEIVTEKKQLEK